MRDWNSLKSYQKALRLVGALAFLIIILLAAIFLVALYLDAGKAELGYEEDTHIEEKRGWWE